MDAVLQVGPHLAKSLLLEEALLVVQERLILLDICQESCSTKCSVIVAAEPCLWCCLCYLLG